MPEIITEEFKAVVDRLVMETNDQEFIDGVKWIDEQATKNNTDFYTETLKVLRKWVASNNAKEWMKQRKNKL